MNKSFFLLLGSFFWSFTPLLAQVNHAENKLNEVIKLADPTIFLHEEVYYLYGTKGDPKIKGEGFLVYTSTDLENWKGPVGARGGFALKEGDAYGTKGFWAPQVFAHNDEFYMAYTANENIAIAKSNNPLGPFEDPDKIALEATVRQIDPYVFKDDDGKVYFYHVRLDEGNKIFVAEMDKDLTEIKTETLRKCIEAKGGWEDTENVSWPVAEGPTVIKKEGVYYLFYSANDFRNPDYAVGYATSDSPLGPWKKSSKNPIINRKLINQNGTGHGDLFKDKTGKLNYVFHTHFSETSVGPRRTGVIELSFVRDEEGNGLYRAEEETFTFLETKE